MKRIGVITLTILLVVFLLTGIRGNTQQTPDTIMHGTVVVAADTTVAVSAAKDSAIATHSPRKAAIRSAILPGLGQIYNKKYWKLPIVYGALGITGYIFVDNIKTYKEYRFAYAARYKAANGSTAADSVDYFKLKPQYRIYQPESIREARDRFRKYIDYSALFFVLFWGLNVVDATVDAHLKTFDISPDLSMRIKPGHSQMAGTNGVSLVFAFRDDKHLLPTFSR